MNQLPSIFLGLAAALLLTPPATANPDRDTARANEMMRCMAYVLKYKRDDYDSTEAKLEEAKRYEDAAIALSSQEYFNETLFRIDNDLMVANMSALTSRSGKETVAYYDELVRQCRIRHSEYQKKK